MAAGPQAGTRDTSAQTQTQQGAWESQWILHAKSRLGSPSPKPIDDVSNAYQVAFLTLDLNA